MKHLSQNFFNQSHSSIQIDQSKTNRKCWYISDADEGICLETVFGTESEAFKRALKWTTDRRSLIEVVQDSLNEKRGAK